jgi:hypothetical protein
VVRQGSNATWQASPLGLGPFTHQWRFNGQDLPSATGSNLTVTAAQLEQEGLYQVVTANTHGSATSAPVRLGLLINPSVISPPVSQSVPEGGDVIFSAQISGHPAPFGYSLRRSATVLTNVVSDERSVFLALRGVTSAAAGTYRIVVTNAANPSPGLTLGPISLSVLADSDRDGLPDAWEAARGLSTNNPADAALDPDGDGLTTASEYLAGTDPFDPLNALRFLPPGTLPGNSDGVVLQFLAVSNRTYTIQHRDSPPGPAGANGAGWQRTADVVATATNRTITLNLTNSADTVQRYYRLATPRIP